MTSSGAEQRGSFRVCTWNVNGIRSIKNPQNVFKTIGADVFCIQETKISRSQIDEDIAFFGGNFSSCFTFPKHQNGYSGCGTYFRDFAKPLNAEYGIHNIDQSDEEWKIFIAKEDISDEDLKNLNSEGRCLVTCHQIKFSFKPMSIKNDENDGDSEQAIINSETNDLRRLYIFNVYFPRLDIEKEGRVEFKDQFNKIIEHKVHNILQDPNSHVIIACDLNISHQRIDSCEPEEDFELSIYRVWLTKFLTPDHSGNRRHMVDSFRKMYPDKKEAYTCWNNKLVGSRTINFGTRIDYLLIDSELSEYIKDVLILNEVHGSDHCPVLCEFKGIDWVSSVNYPVNCTRLWPEFGRKKQTNLKDYFTRIEKPSIGIVPPKKPNCDPPTKCTEPMAEVRIIEKTLKKPSVKFASAINNQKNAFDLLMSGPPPPPLCTGHQQPCKMHICNKKGPNYKRRFWLCTQPIGDPSKPETRCNYFRWLPK